MAFNKIRKFIYRNDSSGKMYEVSLEQQSDGTVNGKGLLLGTNKINSDPDHDNTKVTFVALTANKDDIFGVEGNGWRPDAHLILAAIYDASNKAGAGALLSTLLV